MTAANFINEGNTALQQGKAQEALGAFENAVQSGGGATAWLGIAFAHGHLGDREAQLTAIEKALAIAPKDIAALIAKGDWFDADGDTKSASSFYGSAISLGAQSQSALSQQLISRSGNGFRRSVPAICQRIRTALASKARRRDCKNR